MPDRKVGTDLLGGSLVLSGGATLLSKRKRGALGLPVLSPLKSISFLFLSPPILYSYASIFGFLGHGTLSDRSVEEEKKSAWSLSPLE